MVLRDGQPLDIDATELVALGVFLFFPPLADVLKHAPPSAAGFAVAVLAAPAVLLADAVQKAVIVRRQRVGPSAPALAS